MDEYQKAKKRTYEKEDTYRIQQMADHYNAVAYYNAAANSLLYHSSAIAKKAKKKMADTVDEELEKWEYLID